MNPSHSKPAERATEFDRAQRAASYILSKTKLRPKVALVLVETCVVRSPGFRLLTARCDIEFQVVEVRFSLLAMPTAPGKSATTLA